MNKELESFHAKFRSGNSVAVERAVILRKEYDAVCDEIFKYKKALRRLLNKVNRVTSSFRHNEVTDQDLMDLTDRQIEVENNLYEKTKIHLK